MPPFVELYGLPIYVDESLAADEEIFFNAGTHHDAIRLRYADFAKLAKPFVCQQMVELITDYLEGTLPRAQRRRFEAHLAGCEHCSEYLDQMRRTIDLTGRLRAEELDTEVKAALVAAFRGW